MTDEERAALVQGISGLIMAFIAPLYIRSASKMLNSKNPAFPKLSYKESIILIGAVRMLVVDRKSQITVNNKTETEEWQDKMWEFSRKMRGDN